MMTISLSEVSKRFNRDWIFRKFSYQFTSFNTYAITGPNGSGKSTLLQVIGGAVAASEGEIKYEVRTTQADSLLHNTGAIHVGSESSDDNMKSYGGGATNIPADEAYKYISVAAPYLEVIEEMTANEFLKFHNKFKPLLRLCDIPQILSVVGLERAADKQIRYYSSGMKQRIKLAQAIFSDTPVVLLDEPCTNLDEEGIRLYHHLIGVYCVNRMVIVSSNDIQEYGFCKKIISIMDHK